MDAPIGATHSHNGVSVVLKRANAASLAQVFDNLCCVCDTRLRVMQEHLTLAYFASDAMDDWEITICARCWQWIDRPGQETSGKPQDDTDKDRHADRRQDQSQEVESDSEPTMGTWEPISRLIGVVNEQVRG